MTPYHTDELDGHLVVDCTSRPRPGLLQPIRRRIFWLSLILAACFWLATIYWTLRGAS